MNCYPNNRPHQILNLNQLRSKWFSLARASSARANSASLCFQQEEPVRFQARKVPNRTFEETLQSSLSCGLQLVLWREK